MNCNLCNTEMTEEDQEEAKRASAHMAAHRECLLRAVMGGIGHLIDHDKWCMTEGDPDAGLSYRESALEVDEWVHDKAINKGQDCWRCYEEAGEPIMTYVFCKDCGNKRCPKANDHRNECTNSNDVGQPGSAYEEGSGAATLRRWNT